MPQAHWQPQASTLKSHWNPLVFEMDTILHNNIKTSQLLEAHCNNIGINHLEKSYLEYNIKLYLQIWKYLNLELYGLM